MPSPATDGIVGPGRFTSIRTPNTKYRGSEQFLSPLRRQRSGAIIHQATEIVDQAQVPKLETARGGNGTPQGTPLDDGLIHALCMLPT